MKHRKKLLSILLVVIFLLTNCTCAFGISNTDLDRIYEETGAYLQSQSDSLAVGSVGGEWNVIGLARAGLDIPSSQKNQYLQKVKEYIKENVDEKGKLDPNRSTEHSRIILALTALNEDPRNIAGTDLLYALGDFDYVTRQGINGPIWALIAFDSGNYEVPQNRTAENKVTRELLIEYILENACEGGGWTFMGNTADPDMTAMAIQSLAPYYSTKDEVKTAVDRGLSALSLLQDESGAYVSYGNLNVESTAQVLVALSSLGIDAAKDSRFIKDGNTLLDGIAQFYVDGGGFRHVLEGVRDGMATEQGYYALVAYNRLLDEKTPIWVMTDVAESHFNYFNIVLIAAAIVIGGIIVNKKDR